MKHKPPVDKIDVLVSVADDHMGKIHEVVNGLKAAGLDVSRVMPGGGVITGSVAFDLFPALSKVPGVSSAEISQTYLLDADGGPADETDVDNPRYLAFPRLLGELHALIREDKDEGAEGEAVRERMDDDHMGKIHEVVNGLKAELCSQLSRDEIEAANAVSADLYRDDLDRNDAREAMADAEASGTVPWEQVKTDLGL